MKNWQVWIGYLTLVLIALSMLYPFFAMVNLSFTNEASIFTGAGNFVHTDLTMSNYRNVFSSIPLSRYFLNSLIVAVLTTIGQVVFASMAGYAFARLRFPYRNGLFLLILITMLVPPQVNIIPLFWARFSNILKSLSCRKSRPTLWRNTFMPTSQNAASSVTGKGQSSISKFAKKYTISYDKKQEQFLFEEVA